MAFKNEIIFNPRTGQKILFLKTSTDTEGQLLQMECWSPPSKEKEPLHIHPLQINSFKIFEGELTFFVNGKITRASAGDEISISPKIPHYFWNDGIDEARYVQEFKPALHIESFFCSFFDLAKDDKLNKNGIPNIFQTSLICLAFNKEIRLVNPSWGIQKIVYSICAPLARFAGYRPVYHSQKSEDAQNLNH